VSSAGAGDAIQKSLLVRCSVATAFRIWTEQINQWWPKSHSRHRSPQTVIVFENVLGGRIYERDPDGDEFVWGQVIAWNPPEYFAYHWYLGSSSEQPSRVDITFHAELDGMTRVAVLHTGPALLGERWIETSVIFNRSWDVVLAAFASTYQSVAG
jgi:uncharacterized protein YndB with AHSA1/START domain